MKKNNKGFTLAELLIVVAVIAVLVAIAIPVFSGALAKSKESADEANVRAAYAQAVTNVLTGDASTYPAQGSAGIPNLNYSSKLTSKIDDLHLTADALD